MSALGGMSLPILAKTWQVAHTAVPAQGSGTLDLQHGLRVGIVNALFGLSSPPTVVGSSDSSTANMSGTNLWTADNKLVSAVGAHSWIVLQFGGKFQLCIDLNTASIANMTAVVTTDVAGFATGGTTTARPTATNEVPLINAGAWINNVGSDLQRVWHVWKPTDNSALRIVMFMANAMESWWLVEIPTNASVNWSNPIIAQLHFTSVLDGWGTYSNLFTTGAGVNAKGPSGAFTVGFTSESIGSFAIGQTQTVVNGIDGGYSLMPIGLYSATVGSTGRHGSLEDLWWGSTFPNTGDFYPSDASRQFVHIGDLVYPWDGTSTLQTA